MTIASQELLVALRTWLLVEPLRDRRFVKMDEDALAELLDRRQPVRVRERSARREPLN